MLLRGLASVPSVIRPRVTFTGIGASNAFPALTTQPTVADYLPSPAHTYYCATTGDNSTGDGSIGNPWLDLRGADGNLVAGDLVLFRGGTYGSGYGTPNFAYSTNVLYDDGTAEAPIVISNYPGEIARWEYTDWWSMSLYGDYQYVVGADVSGAKGIQFYGGMSVLGDYCKIVGVEFEGGCGNGGDGNPAMLSIPVQTTITGMHVSHCHFHDTDHDLAPVSRMVCVRVFRNVDTVVEYCLFEDCVDLYHGGAVYCKDQTTDLQVRYNRFIGCSGAFQFTTQGDLHNGSEFHHNLIYGTVDQSYGIINFEADLGNVSPILIYANTVIGSGTGVPFYYYLNADNQDYSEHPEVYDNVIDTTGFEEGWAGTSSDARNLPDVFDYNLWAASADRNHTDFWADQSYHANAQTDAEAVAALETNYSAVTMTVTAPADWAYTTSGRYGGCIGGFSWS